MIPIAKGKFSQPRQPRFSAEEYETTVIDPVKTPAEEPAAPQHDTSLDETMLLTSTFVPVQDDTPAKPVTPPSPVPQETMTFDEAMFMQETVSDDPEESDYDANYADQDDEEAEDDRYQRSGSKRKSKKRKVLLISICSVTALLLVAIIAGIMLFVGGNQDDGLILNNVTVAGVNVGGMTPEEAAAAIHRATDLTYTTESMVINLPDTILELSPADTGAKLDVEAAVEAAYNYGRTGTREENKQAQADSLVSNHTIALLPYLNLDVDYIRGALEEYGEYFNSDYEDSSWTLEGERPVLEGESFDLNATCQTLILNPGKPGRYVDIDKIYNDVLDAYSLNVFTVETKMTDLEQTPAALDLDAIYAQICVEGVNASMDMETFEVTKETYGYGFDLEKAKELLSQTEYGTTIGIPMEFIAPDVVSTDLSDSLFADELAYYETEHTDNENRNHNLKLACEAINGYILMPGDTFDYNEVLGKRTEEAGYKMAGALSAGISTVELGGGICQVSSTLYYTTLLADLEIVDRRSHSLISNYIPMGLDATVSWGGPEFRFKNNFNYPIRIEAEVSDGFVKIRLLGTDEKNYYVEMESMIVQVNPYETVEEVYTEEKAKELGYTDGQVKQQPITGYIVYSYKCKYDKETKELISRDFEARSEYVTLDKIVIKVQKETPSTESTEATDITTPSTDVTTPTTEATTPTTEATTPTTEATTPATEATTPVTEAPPSTEAPATEAPPSTEAPATEPDAGTISDAPTDAPATTPPATEASPAGESSDAA